MDNPRVALVCHEYPPYHIGGVGSHCHDLARFLSSKKVPITVFCGRRPKRTEERINDYLTVVRLPFADVALRAYWFQLQNYSLLREELKNFDIVHAVSPQSGAVAAFLAKDQPLVTTIHAVPRSSSKVFFNTPLYSWSIRELLSNLFEVPTNQWLTKLCLIKSSKVVVVSHTLLKEVATFFPEFPVAKATVIPNGIDFDKLTKIKHRFGTSIQSDSADVLFYGRLVWEKGVTYLIEAASKLRQRYPTIRVKLIGKGPLFNKLRQIVRLSGLSQNVSFLGHLPQDSVLKEIITSTVVVLPSTYEAGSVALLEAMGCGKPIVAFDYPFTREVVRNNHAGLLATPCSSADLAEKIEVLLNDRGLRSTLGQNAFQFVFNENNWEMLADQYIELYRKLLT